MESDTVTFELPEPVYTELQTLAETERSDIVDVLRRLLVAALSIARFFKGRQERGMDTSATLSAIRVFV